MAKVNSAFWYKTKKILIPMFVSLILGLFTFYGGEAYQQIGLEGLDTAKIVLGYILGISEFLLLANVLQRLIQYFVLDWVFSSASGGVAPRLLSQLSAFVVYLLAIAAIIGVVFKKDLTVLLAASSAAGIVVGMALRELIFDIFAGLALNLDRTIRIGDNIHLRLTGNAAIEGTVKEISWRTTQLLTKAYNIVIVPNSRLTSATVTNYSQPKPFFKSNLTVTLDFTMPNDRVMRVLQAAVLEVSGQFSPAEAPLPAIIINNVTSDGVEYLISIYPSFETRTKAKNLAFQAILRHLNCAGLHPASSKPEGFRRRTEKQEIFNQPDPTQLAKLIGTTFLFQDLDKDDRQLLATLTPVRHIPAGTLIVYAGEVATAMFLLIEGLLSAASTRRGKDGKIIAPKTISPGTLIGGDVMLLGSSYEFTIKTKTISLVCEINYATLHGLLVHRPTLAEKFSNRVAKQLSEKIAQEETSQKQWQMSESDLATEVLRNLKRSFTI